MLYEESSSNSISPIEPKIGASLIELTVTVNAFESIKTPSDTRAVNVSEPNQFSDALNTKLLSFCTKLILLPSDIDIFKSLESISSQLRSIDIVSSSLKTKSLTPNNCGASFTGLISIETIPSCSEDSPLSSITENEIKSDP